MHYCPALHKQQSLELLFFRPADRVLFPCPDLRDPPLQKGEHSNQTPEAAVAQINQRSTFCPETQHTGNLSFHHTLYAAPSASFPSKKN